jgi:hypothetical protein
MQPAEIEDGAAQPDDAAEDESAATSEQTPI